jgi:amino acid adenylation domain-containing protein
MILLHRLPVGEDLMLVNEFLEKTTERLPEKTFLIFDDQRFAYRQIDEMSNRFAQGLINASLKRGDRVVVFLENSIESIVAIFGILKAGGIFSVLSPTMKEKKIAYILNDSEASFIVSHWQKWPEVSQAAAKAPSLRAAIMCGTPESPSDIEKPAVIPWDDFIHASPDSNPHVPRIDIDLASIIYTSGSTGEPKGVMLTHLNMTSAADSIITYLENREDDIIMDVLPLSFDYGLYQVLMASKFGGTVVLEKSFVFPYLIIKKMIQERVTGFPGVPTVFAMFLKLNDLEKHDFRQLRYLTNTSAVLPVQHIRLLRKIFPHARIFSMYGLTECKRVSYLAPEEIDRRPDSVGKGMPNEEVFIVDENGNHLGIGQTGELVVRGANVMKGYWKAPEETEKRLRTGRYQGEKVLYTGDLFRMDEGGFLYFVARKDDMIKTRGERVSPKEIEDVLREIDVVYEAAVVPVPDELLGSAIKAFLVIEPGKSIAVKDILQFCARNLESFMVPKYVEFIDTFPRASTGKIDKNKLNRDPSSAVATVVPGKIPRNGYEADV